MKEHHIPLDLILRAQQGDQPAIQWIISSNHYLITKFAIHYVQYTRSRIDDLYQAGRLGVWKAIQDYNPSHSSGCSFFTYTYNWVRAYVGREAFRYHHKKDLQLFSDLPEEGEALKNYIRKPIKVLSELEEAIESLETRTRNVLYKRYGFHGHNPKTVEELGEEMGITNVRVSQIEKEGLSTIKYILENGRKPRSKSELLENPNIKNRVDKKKDLFPQVLKYHQEGKLNKYIVKMTGLCDRTIRNWLKQV